jgi:hypothetical protein
MPFICTRGVTSALAYGFGASSAGGAGKVYVDGVEITPDSYFTYSTPSPRIVTVSSPRNVTFYLWGAAGGNGGYSAGNYSGAGGYVKVTVAMQVQNYYLYVGEGGRAPSSYSYGQGGLGGYPNGGYGTVGDASGAGGGGMTMLSLAPYSTGMSAPASIVAIAGGGGGTCGYSGSAGAGGGTNGQNASSGPATGGTQSSGGTYNGAYLLGGNATGSRTGGSDDGGGGGGGLYGGGGGTSDARPAAGGSGYVNPGGIIISSVMLTGNYQTPPDPENKLLSTSYAWGKIDGAGTVQNGNPGLVLITF